MQTSKTGTSFVPFDERFLNLSWAWLEDPELRMLIDAPAFSKEQQKAWFHKLPSMHDYMIWGVLYETVPVGVCGLKNIALSDGEYWGYIGDKQYWGKGIGKAMLSFIESIARKNGLSAVYLNVLQQNARARHLYMKYGFKVIHETDEQLRMRKCFAND